MPLLEVNQTRHLSASIRLTDTTASQVDQYAAFIAEWSAIRSPCSCVFLPHRYSSSRDA
jgi:hypothetical protein